VSKENHSGGGLANLRSEKRYVSRALLTLRPRTLICYMGRVLMLALEGAKRVAKEIVEVMGARAGLHMGAGK